MTATLKFTGNTLISETQIAVVKITGWIFCELIKVSVLAYFMQVD